MKEIKLNNKVVKTIQVNNNKRVVTVVSNDMNAKAKNVVSRLIDMLRMEEGKNPLNTEPIEEKVITQSKPNANDEFDPYIGVALALAYNLFGSKTQFRKYVKEEILKVKEEVEAKKAINELKNPVEKKEEVNKATKEVKNYKDPEESLYDNYTLQELRAMAKERGLKGYSGLTKSELVNLIVESFII